MKSPIIWKQEFNELLLLIAPYVVMHIGGTKLENVVGCVCIINDRTYMFGL